MTSQPICFYYGAGRLDELCRYRRVVLQPELYSADELKALTDRRVEPLGYLALSEDHGPPAPWQRPARNADWGGAFVQVGHPGWIRHIIGQVQATLNKGFTGLFLDTLNIEFTYPEDLPDLLALIGAIREEAKTAYLLANRGFALLPQLADFVDGILFESFSVRWVPDGYALWPPDALEVHAQMAERLLKSDLDLYALDYADTWRLADFARRRAQQFGLLSFVSDRTLSRV
jgi:polysaccharide biosynthesis protein PelA